MLYLMLGGRKPNRWRSCLAWYTFCCNSIRCLEAYGTLLDFFIPYLHEHVISIEFLLTSITHRKHHFINSANCSGDRMEDIMCSY